MIFNHFCAFCVGVRGWGTPLSGRQNKKTSRQNSPYPPPPAPRPNVGMAFAHPEFGRAHPRPSQHWPGGEGVARFRRISMCFGEEDENGGIEKCQT